MQIGVCESVEELVRYEVLAVKIANDTAYEWQKRVTNGDCFRRMHDSIEIYGEVLSDYGEGVRACRCYSLLCPDGEVGCVHVSQMGELIDSATFSKMKTKLSKAWKMAKSAVENEFPIERLESIGI